MHTFTWKARHLVIVAVIGALLGLWLSPGRAYGSPVSCQDAWQAPRSAKANACRDRGWIIRPHLVVGRGGQVRWTDLRPCYYEDSLRCWWDADSMGVPGGRSFVALGRTEERPRMVWVAGFRL